MRRFKVFEIVEYEIREAAILRVENDRAIVTEGYWCNGGEDWRSGVELWPGTWFWDFSGAVDALNQKRRQRVIEIKTAITKLENERSRIRSAIPASRGDVKSHKWVAALPDGEQAQLDWYAEQDRRHEKEREKEEVERLRARLKEIEDNT